MARRRPASSASLVVTIPPSPLHPKQTNKQTKQFGVLDPNKRVPSYIVLYSITVGYIVLDGWLIKCFSFYTYKGSSEH